MADRIWEELGYRGKEEKPEKSVDYSLPMVSFRGTTVEMDRYFDPKTGNEYLFTNFGDVTVQFSRTDNGFLVRDHGSLNPDEIIIISSIEG